MKNHCGFPLVIISAFSPKPDVPYVAIKKGEMRNRETLYSIAWWLCKSDFDKIVIVESTGYEFPGTALTDLASCAGKTMEYIAIENDHKSVARYGKGFGEGFALDMAFDKSSLLQGCDGFFKCTAKVIVDNYLDCVAQARTREFYFDAPRRKKGFIDTRFYYTSTTFWKEHLRYAYKAVDDSRGVFLEHAYSAAIRRVRDIPFNPVVIRYRGISGSSGVSYEVSAISYMLKLMARKGYWLCDRIQSMFRRRTAQQ